LEHPRCNQNTMTGSTAIAFGTGPQDTNRKHKTPVYPGALQGASRRLERTALPGLQEKKPLFLRGFLKEKVAKNQL
ncbi:MAG: hypothetical protein AAF497_15485, partial [Planctomycetota bacterium]